MNEFIQFFLEPYKTAETSAILLELTAAIFGIISVFYAKKENILVFPTGIISTGIYVYLLSQWNLYGDLIINIYYTLMSIYGWYIWSRPVTDQQKTLPISRTTKQDKLKTFGIFLFTSLFVIVVYRYYNVMPNELSFSETLLYIQQKLSDKTIESFRLITPYIDTFTTGIFFAGMWLMANKKLENWTFWIVGNLFSIPLYFIKGYGFTGIQYFIFLILAIQGYNAWKKVLNKNQ